MKHIKQIEDIYPLTIVRSRYAAGKIVILNVESDCTWVQDVQMDESVGIELEKWLKENVTVQYGIGNTVWEAFENFKEINK